MISPAEIHLRTGPPRSADDDHRGLIVELQRSCQSAAPCSEQQRVVCRDGERRRSQNTAAGKSRVADAIGGAQALRRRRSTKSRRLPPSHSAGSGPQEIISASTARSACRRAAPRLPCAAGESGLRLSKRCQGSRGNSATTRRRPLPKIRFSIAAIPASVNAHAFGRGDLRFRHRSPGRYGRGERDETES
jgi:hypothetical protein